MKYLMLMVMMMSIMLGYVTSIEIFMLMVMMIVVMLCFVILIEILMLMIMMISIMMFDHELGTSDIYLDLFISF